MLAFAHSLRNPGPGLLRLTYTSGLLLFLAIGFLLFQSSLVDHEQRRAPGNEIVARSTIPLRDVWGGQRPGWRQSIPPTSPANDSAMPPSRLGLVEVMTRDASPGCVPAVDRLGPFGHSSGKLIHKTLPWEDVRWGQLQRDCARLHRQRASQAPSTLRLSAASPEVDRKMHSSSLDNWHTGQIAVVLRTWDRFEYTEDQRAWIRTMATELALDTGGRFQLILLVDVKDPFLDLWTEEIYAEMLESSVPEEFRDMAILFNKRILREWFPKVDIHTAQDQMYQPLQILSYTYPGLDYFWQLEMDARFTGNIANFLEDITLWADTQPRQHLWERNARWVVPDLFSTYTSFKASVDAELDSSAHETIWGPPSRAERYISPQGPKPPSRSDVNWGIGEAPDLITLAPMIDPVGSNWTFEHKIHGFQPLHKSQGFNDSTTLPRRMAIISMTRTSRRLLRLISLEQRTTGSWINSEATPETWAFLHGLKAVYAPHLISFNPKEEAPKFAEDLEKMVHKGPAWNRAGGPLTGHIWCDFEDGRPYGIPEPTWETTSYYLRAGDAKRLWWEYTNGSCTWPLLLHPVKTG